MTRPTVVHLVDDTTAGGVMRVLDHIMTAPALQMIAHHSLKCVARTHLSLGHIEADVIVSHLAVSWRALPMLVSLRLRHPSSTLIHVEHSYTESFVAQNVTSKGRFARLLRTAYRLFDRVVAVSEAQGRWLTASGAVKAPSLAVIPSCVDLSAFRDIKRPSGPIKVIGAIGRLDRQKGFDTLIEAFRQTRAPDIALHIYGEGEQESWLRSLAAGDPRIRFKGFAADPVAAMAAVDAVAIPSRWEAYGLVAIETLAAGRRLLVNRIDGLQDHLCAGAEAVQGGEVSDWCRAIKNLTADDADNTISPIRRIRSFEDEFTNNWGDLLSGLALRNRRRLPEWMNVSPSPDRRCQR